MVEALRQGDIRCQADAALQGLYVIEQSNAQNLSIPHLPLLRETGDPGVFRVEADFSVTSGPLVQAPDLHKSFSSGDIVWLDGRAQMLRTVLSANSNANTLLVTERCDNRCLFCSQPPNELPDEALYTKAALALLNFNGEEFVGISGGEPTLNEPAFLALLRSLKSSEISTPLHILSNGRRFSEPEFASRVQEVVGDRSVLWGIPLYGHRASLHDYLVSAENAFVDTVRGLLNLGSIGQAIELRIVPSLANYQQLESIVSFVVSAFPFIKIISIMNLEPKGWGRKNYEALYVPVREQDPHLAAAIARGTEVGIDVRLFNYPLCLLQPSNRQYAYKTISDWKNYYPEECGTCSLIDDCGGFFSSATGKFIEQVEAQ